MNKFFKYFLVSLLGLFMITSCNSNPEFDNNITNNSESGDMFISVAVEMTSTPNSRTTVDSFDDGTEEESTISNIVFFFFDNVGNCIEVQKIDNPRFMDPAVPDINPNITNYGVVEVRLKSGLSYNKVGVALNSPAQNATELKSSINTINDFLERSYDYAAAVKADGSGQVMSNSIYYAMDKSSDIPIAGKKVNVITITDKNVYTSSQKNNIDQLIASGEKEYVNIFVERVLAKIEVEQANFNMTDYYVIEENGTKKTTITLYDNVNGTSKEIKIQPVVTGMILNVLAPNTALVKPLQINEVGYGVGDGLYKNFQWNDPVNRRSYWASTILFDVGDMNYFSWNQAKNHGNVAITQYIHPNTQDYKPIVANEGSSLNTKLMISAELHEFDGNTDKGAVDLVMYGADYMLANDLLAHIASLVNRDIRSIDWSTVNFGVELTNDQIYDITTSVYNAFQNETGYKGDDLIYTVGAADEDSGFGDEDWAAIVSFKSVPVPTINGLPDGTLNTVTTEINKVRAATMDRINANRILYWKGGKTYFYTNIRHQGFTGLVGNADTDFLYGVVRNHVYKINLTGIYGLGTPVIDPDRPINPDRPNDGRVSYIKAKINILPWRIVTNNAVIH